MNKWMDEWMNEWMWQLDGKEIFILVKFTYDCILCGNPWLLNKEDDTNKAQSKHGECSVKYFGRKLKWLWWSPLRIDWKVGGQNPAASL
jgi:hypothetical protein